MKLTVENINEKIAFSAKDYICECEENYRKKLEEIRDTINKSGEGRTVMLAGPSSSGKTTTARILRQMLTESGRNTVTVSLDDFYLDQKNAPVFPDGRPDFETVHALDIQRITHCLTELSKEGKSVLPVFDFNLRKPSEKTNTVEIDKNGIIIVEGLHALNPLITKPIENENMLKLYVSVSSRIFGKDDVIFTKRDIRFIRRMIRDYKFRNSPVDFTFYLWKAVRTGEDKYLFPFSGEADIKIDSIHPYELSVYRNRALELLSHIEKDSTYFRRAQELKEKLSLMRELDRSDVPENSLLHEFIG